MNSPMPLLLVASPGRKSEGLQAILRTIPEIEIVGQADHVYQTMAMIAQHQPSLILIDSSLTTEDILPALAQIKGGYPRTRCIVLVDNIKQQSASREAGADCALITGFSTQALHEAIDQILVSFNNKKQSDEEVQHDGFDQI